MKADVGGSEVEGQPHEQYQRQREIGRRSRSVLEGLEDDPFKMPKRRSIYQGFAG